MPSTATPSPAQPVWSCTLPQSTTDKKTNLQNKSPPLLVIFVLEQWLIKYISKLIYFSLPTPFSLGEESSDDKMHVIKSSTYSEGKSKLGLHSGRVSDREKELGTVRGCCDSAFPWSEKQTTKYIMGADMFFLLTGSRQSHRKTLTLAKSSYLLYMCYFNHFPLGVWRCAVFEGWISWWLSSHCLLLQATQASAGHQWQPKPARAYWYHCELSVTWAPVA